MSNWTEDVDTEGDPGRRKRNDARRAIIGGVAGVAMLVGPIALANSIIPDGDDSDVSTDEASSTSLIALRAAEGNRQADSAQLQSLMARQTTSTLPPTTLPPPPPETTTTTAAPTTTTTEAPPMTTPPTAPPPVDGQLGDPNFDGSWDALAQCEAGGNWAINTGNGYYGGLQFSLSTWQGIGGSGYPHEHPHETQIAMGKQLWQTSGWGAWPACTRKLGYR